MSHQAPPKEALIVSFLLQGANKQKKGRLFTWSDCDKTRRSVFRLKEGRLDYSAEIHQYRLPGEVVDASSLETFKDIQGWMRGAWNWVGFKVLSNLSPSMIL